MGAGRDSAPPRSNFPSGKRHVLTVLRQARQRCIELPGPHFDFDKSFVRPEGLQALSEVFVALDADPDRRAMVFGHTDTVGTEHYNKLLSERRARAVFAVLVQDPKAWETLHGQESWGLHPIQVMLNAVSDAPPIAEDGKNSEETKEAVKAFQSAHPPLQVDGDPGPRTRHELYLAYFKKANATPADATRFQDFGAEKIMGCGEYNPFVPDEVKDEKSRRVVVIVFDPGAKPDKLPCKIGDEGPCQANLVGKNDPPPDPQAPFFRCKIFAKIAAKCPRGLPVDPGVGTWEVPGVDVTNGTIDDVPDASWVVSTVIPVPGTGDLPPPGQCAVNLLDDAGDPIAGITLRTAKGSGATDSSGRAVLGGSLPGDPVSAQAADLRKALGGQPFTRPFLRRDDKTWASIADLAQGVTVADQDATIVVVTRVVVSVRSSVVPLDACTVRQQATKAAVTQGVTTSKTQVRIEALSLGEGVILEVVRKQDDGTDEVVAAIDLDSIASQLHAPKVQFADDTELALPESAPDVGSPDDEPTRKRA